MVLVTVVNILLKQRSPSHVHIFPILYRIEAAKNNNDRTHFGYILAFIDELNPFLDKDLNTFRVKS